MRGEVPIWIHADGNGLKAKYVDHAPVETVIAAEGTIAMPLVVGMVKNDAHPEATKKYLDWLLTDKAQSLFAEAFFRPVMKVDLDAKLKQQFLPDSDYAKTVVLPLSEMAAQSNAVKERWTKEIRGNR